MTCTRTTHYSYIWLIYYSAIFTFIRHQYILSLLPAYILLVIQILQNKLYIHPIDVYYAHMYILHTYDQDSCRFMVSSAIIYVCPFLVVYLIDLSMTNFTSSVFHHPPTLSSVLIHLSSVLIQHETYLLNYHDIHSSHDIH